MSTTIKSLSLIVSDLTKQIESLSSEVAVLKSEVEELKARPVGRVTSSSHQSVRKCSICYKPSPCGVDHSQGKCDECHAPSGKVHGTKCSKNPKNIKVPESNQEEVVVPMG